MANQLEELKASLKSLKENRDQLNREVLNERSEVKDLETRVSNLRKKFEAAKNELQEKERALNRYQEVIEQSEKVYTDMMKSTDSLKNAIDSENQNSFR